MNEEIESYQKYCTELKADAIKEHGLIILKSKDDPLNELFQADHTEHIKKQNLVFKDGMVFCDPEMD